MIDIDCLNSYDVVFCPELGDMCDMTKDCIYCYYRNNYVDIKGVYKPKEIRLIIV